MLIRLESAMIPEVQFFRELHGLNMISGSNFLIISISFRAIHDLTTFDRHYNMVCHHI